MYCPTQSENTELHRRHDDHNYHLHHRGTETACPADAADMQQVEPFHDIAVNYTSQLDI